MTELRISIERQDSRAFFRPASVREPQGIQSYEAAALRQAGSYSDRLRKR